MHISIYKTKPKNHYSQCDATYFCVMRCVTVYYSVLLQLPVLYQGLHSSLQARVGRREAELAGRTPTSQARQSTTDLEPISIAQKRVLAVNRGPRATPTPAHAPKFSSPMIAESTRHRSVLSLASCPFCFSSFFCVGQLFTAPILPDIDRAVHASG